MNKEFNAIDQVVEIVQTAKARSTGELVDTGADIVQVVQILERELGDGFQWDDLFGFLEGQPVVNELVRDMGIAVTELLAALPGETIMAAIQINQEARRRGPVGKYSTAVLGFFYVVASGYKSADQILQVSNMQKNMILDFIKGDLEIPAEVPLLLQG